MQKLKSIFSPRKIIIILLIIVGIMTVPGLNAPAMSETEAIVTLLCMDKQEDKIVMSATVLSPGPDNVANYQVFTGSGDTLSNAVEAVSLSIGKEMGFAQCEVMALGENLCTEGVMQTLDFMTRTKKVGRNAYLVSFAGDINDFSESMSNLNKEKSLSLEKILSFDKRYVLTKNCNIENFYIGYFNDLSLGIMPRLEIKNSESDNAIEVASGGQTSGDQAEAESGQKEKKYFLNDGSLAVFKKGKHVLDVDSEMVKKMNFFVNNSQQGALTIENVNDDLYENANVIVDIVRKKNEIGVRFENDTPIFRNRMEVVVFVEQVLGDQPKENLLKRNNDFLTPTLLEHIKEKIQSDMQDCIDFCKTNSVDLIDAYKHFSKLTSKKFDEYLKTHTKENFLDDITFEFDLHVSNEY